MSMNQYLTSCSLCNNNCQLVSLKHRRQSRAQPRLERIVVSQAIRPLVTSPILPAKTVGVCRERKSLQSTRTLSAAVEERADNAALSPQNTADPPSVSEDATIASPPVANTPQLQAPKSNFTLDRPAPSNFRRDHGQNRPQRNGRYNGSDGTQPVPNDLKVGQTVTGEVVWCNENGAKIQIWGSNVVGYMPAKEGPYAIRDCLRTAANNEPFTVLEKGLIREYHVVRNSFDRGPLLSARSYDWDLAWKRALQLFEASQQDSENFKVKVLGVNQGGLLSRLEGLQLFVPVSQLHKPQAGDWWTQEELRSQFPGQELEVCINEIDPPKKKLVASEVRADENRGLRRIKVGAVLWGTIRRVEPFGAFVGIDDTHSSGLIHISNVSRMHVRDIREVFRVGDRVRCLVMGVSEGFTNISLSTAELEVEDGDMLNDPQRVYETAEEQQQYFLEHLANIQDLIRRGEYDENDFMDPLHKDPVHHH